MNKTYDEKSIQSLSPLEFTRLRPGVYCGSTENSNQLLIEVLMNAIDEHIAGHGDRITITANTQNNEYTIADNGQGFLVNSIRPEDGRTVLEAAFSIMNTSGKFSDDGVYNGIGLGLNGIGAKITNFLSHYCVVRTVRQGLYEKITFKEGIFQTRETGKTKEACGTTVTWQPSEEFFSSPSISMPAIESLCEKLSFLLPSLTIVLNDKEYHCGKGLEGWLDLKAKEEIVKNRLIFSYKKDKLALDFALTYTSSYSTTIAAHVNTGETDSGPHITQIKTLITRELNRFFKEKGWIKDNLSGEDCQEGLLLIFNLTTTGVSYDAQTKSRIVKLDMSPFTSTIAAKLRDWCAANEKDLKKIVDKALAAKRAREAAKKAKEAARQTTSKKSNDLKTKLAMSDRVKDCTARNPKENSLLIVEGNSAASAAIEARDPARHAIMMLRGKTLSSLKTTDEKVFSNAVYQDITSAIGAGIGRTFDLNKMNYHKIVITADAKKLAV